MGIRPASRIPRNALNATFALWYGEHEMQVPDNAKDMFTAAGRRMGRGPEFFISTSGKLENEATEIVDPYAESGPAAWLARETRPPAAGASASTTAVRST